MRQSSSSAILDFSSVSFDPAPHASPSMRARLHLMWLWVKSHKMILFVCFMALLMITLMISMIGGDDVSRKIEMHKRLYRYQDSYLKYNFSSSHYRIAMISDRDLASKTENGWESALLYADLYRDPSTGRYALTLQPPTFLTWQTNEAGRGMELSELVEFNGRLLAVDDRTGIVMEVDTGKEKVYAVYILAEGNGKSSKGMKCEWAAVRGDKLYIGSIGKEWINKKGEIVNYTPNWVKVIDSEGRLHAEDWTNVYTAMRVATGTTFPGYMVHEAATWNPVTMRWYFLPRRASTEAYEEEADEDRGTNKLISFVSELDPSSTMTVTTVPGLNTQRGFSSLKFVPGHETEIVALKTQEYRGQISSYLTVFNLYGQILLEDSLLGDIKFEGVEFI